MWEGSEPHEAKLLIQHGQWSERSASTLRASLDRVRRGPLIPGSFSTIVTAISCTGRMGELFQQPSHDACFLVRTVLHRTRFERLKLSEQP